MKGLYVFAALSTLAMGSGAPAMKFQAPPRGSINIYRDTMGVPHVFGRTEEDAFFGAGYALGQDRLAQSELGLRRARGTLAEILGPSALLSDREARKLGRTDAELLEALNRVSPPVRRMIRATVAGLNKAIDEANADPAHKLPYEYKGWGILPRRWTVLDYVASMAANWGGYGSAGGSELLNLDFYNDLVTKFGTEQARLIFDDILPLDDPSAVPIVAPSEFIFKWPAGSATATSWPRAAAQLVGGKDARPSADYTALDEGRALGMRLTGGSAGASRALVVGAGKSESGKVMLLESTSENPDVHLVAGALDVVGFTTPPGIPPLMGRSRHIGWITTTGEDDIVDTFAERLKAEDRHVYWYKGAWRNMTVRTEKIRVKGGTDEIVEVASTVHGPVLTWSQDGKTAYTERNALRGYEMVNWEARLEMARAQTLQEFERGVSRVPTDTNILYGDDKGHIAVWHVGRVPIRAKGVDPRLPTPGTGEYDWLGIVPFGDMPRVIDPKAGFIHAWNNKAADGFSYGDASRYGESFRTWLGVALAQSKAKLSMDDMRDINRKIGLSAGGVDTSATSPKFFTPYLVEAVKGDPRLVEAVQLMASWNGSFEDNDGDGRYDNPGLTLFRTWLPIAQEKIMGASIGAWWHRIDDGKYVKYRTQALLRAVAGPRAELPMKHDWFEGRPREEVMRETVAKTVEKLEKEYGRGDMSAWKMPIYWKYFDPAQERLNPDKPPFPGSEGLATTAARLGQAPAFVPDNLSEEWNVLMQIGAPGDPIIFDSTPLGGQSQFVNQAGRAGPHVADQIQLHAKFQFKTVNMAPTAVASQAETFEQIKVPSSY